MQYHPHHDQPDQHLDFLAQKALLEKQLGLQICSELLLQSRNIILGALAWKGWLEHGRSLVIINLTHATDSLPFLDLPIGIIGQDNPAINAFGAAEVVRQYNPDSEGILVICQQYTDYVMAYICIFTPSFPPEVCYQEVTNRPSEFDFNFADNTAFNYGLFLIKSPHTIPFFWYTF